MKRIVLPALALLLAGCGAPETADPQVRQQLIAQVNAVKTAALGNDRAGAETALADLNRGIATAQAQGKLTPDYARTILEAADRVADDVRTIPLPPPPPPVIVTVTPEPPPEEEVAQEQEKQREEQQKQWEERLKQWEEQRDREEKRQENNGKDDD